MRTRIFRPIATFITLMLLVAVPAQASPVKFTDIVNVMGDLQRGGQIERLRLRVAQDPRAPQTLSTPSSSSATTSTPAVQGDTPLASSLVPGSEAPTPSLVSGTEIAPQQPQGEIQVFEQDNVDGTICDCGEIPAVGGGFPKWPFLALIPLICVTGICTHHLDIVPSNECVTCPTPTPTPPVPEPASLLLFGSGIVALSAGARRRYARMRATRQCAAMTEE